MSAIQTNTSSSNLYQKKSSPSLPKGFRPSHQNKPYTPLSHFRPLSLPSAQSSYFDLPKKISEALDRVESLEERGVAKKDLLKTRSIELPPLTDISPDDEVIILWRGCGAEQLIKVILYKSFSRSPNPNTTPPSQEEAINQVGEQTNFPEFTRIQQVAEQFGSNQFVAAFAIEKRYLTQGSFSEGGYLCRHDAPVELVNWKEGRQLFSQSEEAKLASERRRECREKFARKES